MTDSRKPPTGPAVAINESAPVILDAEIEIAAPPELVWDVLSSIERWPTWNPEVRSASVDGGLAQGNTFRWKAGPSSLTSKLLTVAEPSEIAWSGRSMGLSVIHVYKLEPHEGHTLVRTVESVEGMPARLFRGPVKRRMDAAIDNGLKALKAEAERRAAT